MGRSRVSEHVFRTLVSSRPVVQRTAAGVRCTTGIAPGVVLLCCVIDFPDLVLNQSCGGWVRDPCPPRGSKRSRGGGVSRGGGRGAVLQRLVRRLDLLELLLRGAVAGVLVPGGRPLASQTLPPPHPPQTCMRTVEGEAGLVSCAGGGCLPTAGHFARREEPQPRGRGASPQPTQGNVRDRARVRTFANKRKQHSFRFAGIMGFVILGRC